jgi:hypothetical protein
MVGFIACWENAQGWKKPASQRVIPEGATLALKLSIHSLGIYSKALISTNLSLESPNRPFRRTWGNQLITKIESRFPEENTGLNRHVRK